MSATVKTSHGQYNGVNRNQKPETRNQKPETHFMTILGRNR